MNPKRFVWSALAVYLVDKTTSILIHGIWLGDWYRAAGGPFRSAGELEALAWVPLATGIAVAALFTYVYVRGFAGDGLPAWLSGLRYGAVMALFYNLPVAFDSFAVYRIPLGLALRWLVAGCAVAVASGLVVAAVYRSGDGRRR